MGLSCSVPGSLHYQDTLILQSQKSHWYAGSRVQSRHHNHKIECIGAQQSRTSSN